MSNMSAVKSEAAAPHSAGAVITGQNYEQGLSFQATITPNTGDIGNGINAPGRLQKIETVVGLPDDALVVTRVSEAEAYAAAQNLSELFTSADTTIVLKGPNVSDAQPTEFDQYARDRTAEIMGNIAFACHLPA